MQAAIHSNTLQPTATHCDTLQHPATSCNTLQHPATLTLSSLSVGCVHTASRLVVFYYEVVRLVGSLKVHISIAKKLCKNRVQIRQSFSDLGSLYVVVTQHGNWTFLSAACILLGIWLYSIIGWLWFVGSLKTARFYCEKSCLKIGIFFGCVHTANFQIVLKHKFCGKCLEGWFSAVFVSTQFNTLQHTSKHCRRLHLTAPHYTTRHRTLQHAARHYDTLHHAATHCSTLQHTTAHCKIVMFHARLNSTHGNMLQPWHTAPHCKIVVLLVAQIAASLVKWCPVFIGFSCKRNPAFKVA